MSLSLSADAEDKGGCGRAVKALCSDPATWRPKRLLASLPSAPGARGLMPYRGRHILWSPHGSQRVTKVFCHAHDAAETWRAGAGHAWACEAENGALSRAGRRRGAAEGVERAGEGRAAKREATNLCLSVYTVIQGFAELTLPPRDSQTG